MPPKPKPPTLPLTTQQLAGVLSSVTSGIEALMTSNPELKESVQQSIKAFFAHPTITKTMGTTQLPAPSQPPSNLLEDIKSIKTTLSALQKAIAPSPQAGKATQNNKPDSTPLAPVTRAKGKTQPLTFASAAASLPRPSVVVSLAHLGWTDGRPSPANLCLGINSALEASDSDQIRISAARWTARDNVILTSGPNTTAQQLQQAIPTIRQHLATYQNSDENTLLSPPIIRPNLKWSKLLINSVPTGVSTSRPAMTPEECHAALATDNPSYAMLNVTQRPSWVRNPTSYTEGAVSSLVVVFEDPDGSIARGLLANKVLYAFGHCATLRKWKQCPTTLPPHPEIAINTLTEDTEHTTPMQQLFQTMLAELAPTTTTTTTAATARASPRLAELATGSIKTRRGGWKT